MTAPAGPRMRPMMSTVCRPGMGYLIGASSAGGMTSPSPTLGRGAPVGVLRMRAYANVTPLRNPGGGASR